MTAHARGFHRVTTRRLTLLLALAGAALALFAAPSVAQPPRTDYPGEIGTVVDRSGDGFVPSLRFRGAQRYDTARLIAEESFTGTDEVLIARSNLFPDALSGSFLAGHLEAPLLLAHTDQLTADTRDSLARLDPDRVTLLGQTNAISAEVEQELRDLGYNVERVGGVHRWETARMVATHPETSVGEREHEEFNGRAAIVARADDFPDALVAGSVSYASNFPLLLTSTNDLSPDTEEALQELDIETVIVPGGSSAVSDAVVAEMEDMGISVDRVRGQDRVATSVEFALFARDELDYTLDRLNMSRGDKFPDALTLGPHAGAERHPIVLTVSPSTLGGGGTVAELLSLTCEVNLLHVAGGHAAIQPDLEQEMRELATTTGAICDLEFTEGDEGDPIITNELSEESRTVTVSVQDNAGNPANDEADVRFQVFRGAHGLEDADAVPLFAEGVQRSENQQASFTYAGSAEPARDYVVACTVSAASETDEPGEDPGSCLDDPDVDTLVVADGEPQNIGDGLAWSWQIKEWGEPAEPAAPAQLMEAQACDMGALFDLLTDPEELLGLLDEDELLQLVEDLVDLGLLDQEVLDELLNGGDIGDVIDEVGDVIGLATTQQEDEELLQAVLDVLPLNEILDLICRDGAEANFGGNPLDVIRLGFDKAITPLVSPEFDGSITVTTEGGGEVEIESLFDGGTLFASSGVEVDLGTGDLPVDPDALGIVLEQLDDLTDHQVLLVSVLPDDIPTVTNLFEQSVVDIDGITDTEGREVVVPEPRQFEQLPLGGLDEESIARLVEALLSEDVLNELLGILEGGTAGTTAEPDRVHGVE